MKAPSAGVCRFAKSVRLITNTAEAPQSYAHDPPRARGVQSDRGSVCHPVTPDPKIATPITPWPDYNNSLPGPLLLAWRGWQHDRASLSPALHTHSPAEVGRSPRALA